MARLRIRVAAAALVVATAPLGGQETASPPSSRQSIWLVYGGDHGVSNRFGIVFDAQLRMTQNATHERQVLLRPGVSFAVNKALKLSTGYTVTAARDDGSDPFFTRRPEHRAWVSAQYAHSLGPVTLGHRYRAEHRWLPAVGVDAAGLPVGDERVTAERMRYSVRATLPLPTGGSGRSMYLAASDEVFASFGGVAGDVAVDQNRAAVVLGMRATRTLRLEMGYMLQASGSGGRLDERNHTLQFGVFSTAKVKN